MPPGVSCADPKVADSRTGNSRAPLNACLKEQWVCAIWSLSPWASAGNNSNIISTSLVFFPSGFPLDAWVFNPVHWLLEEMEYSSKVCFIFFNQFLRATHFSQVVLEFQLKEQSINGIVYQDQHLISGARVRFNRIFRKFFFHEWFRVMVKSADPPHLLFSGQSFHIRFTRISFYLSRKFLFNLLNDFSDKVNCITAGWRLKKRKRVRIFSQLFLVA